MNAKPLVITLVIAITLGLLSWVRGDSYPFDIRTIFPFTDGQGISIHQWGRIALLILGAWGLWRLYRGPRAEEEHDPVMEDPTIDEPTPPSDDNNPGPQSN